MKHKFLTLALMAAMSSTMLFSCQNAEEPNIPALEAEPDEDMVEYSISVNIPDEMRTRAASTATIGESGLYEFPQRTIDKLWYAMYYDGELKSYNTITRTNTSPFSFTQKLSNTYDPSKISYFFWAGNKDDVISENSKGTTTNITGLCLNYNAKLVIASPYAINNNSYICNNNVFDSFSGYYSLSLTNSWKEIKTSFTLKRPFAEFHILCDDFLPETSQLYTEYSQGVSVFIGFGDQLVNKSNVKDQTLIPSIWHYDSNQFEYADPNYGITFINSLGVNSSVKTLPVERTTFKNREMDYIGLFYILAPQQQTHFSLNNSSTRTLNKLNLSFLKLKKGSVQGYGDCDAFATIELPEDGLKANNKYVIYNKPVSEGGTGFLEGWNSFEILVDQDGTWEEPNTEQESDRL